MRLGQRRPAGAGRAACSRLRHGRPEHIPTTRPVAIHAAVLKRVSDVDCDANSDRGVLREDFAVRVVVNLDNETHAPSRTDERADSMKSWNVNRLPISCPSMTSATRARVRQAFGRMFGSLTISAWQARDSLPLHRARRIYSALNAMTSASTRRTNPSTTIFRISGSTARILASSSTAKIVTGRSSAIPNKPL